MVAVQGREKRLDAMEIDVSDSHDTGLFLSRWLFEERKKLDQVTEVVTQGVRGDIFLDPEEG